jgi:hypothetical protein
MATFYYNDYRLVHFPYNIFVKVFIQIYLNGVLTLLDIFEQKSCGNSQLQYNTRYKCYSRDSHLI